MYFALTQEVAEWILPKVQILDALCDFLKVVSESPITTEFAHGPVRIILDSTGEVLAFIHSDYLISGQQRWGFVKLTEDMSLSKNPEIFREVLERAAYVISQRLRGLLVDGAFFHRKYDDGVHTLLAGRGTAARQYSIAYVEQHSTRVAERIHAILCVGPGHNWNEIRGAALAESGQLPRLAAIADSLVISPRAPRAASMKSFRALVVAIDSYNYPEERQGIFDNVQVKQAAAIGNADSLKTMGFTYGDWVADGSPLNDTQRRILRSDVLDKHPLRITGPAGSGKTLLMQLLAIKVLLEAQKKESKFKLLYIVHSDAMNGKVTDRFEQLAQGSATSDRNKKEGHVFVTTLAEYCRTELELQVESVINRDATDAKLFQLEQVTNALIKLRENALAGDSELLKEVFRNDELLRAFGFLTLAEISVSIKGHGLQNDKKQYVESERSLSRFHGVLNKEERAFVFDVFRAYHQEVFEAYKVLDPDDIALSLAGRLRTPVWELRRVDEGFDYVFVDEAQLFNENERRIFPLLTRGITHHVPIALALDEAQSIYSQFTSGLATLGIRDIANESLDSIQRSTTAITKLAFFVIQKSIALFGPEFPKFPNAAQAEGFREADKHTLASAPKIIIEPKKSQEFGKFIDRMVRDFRKENVRQIAVVCHAEQYWEDLELALSDGSLPFQVLRERGERLPSNDPIVILCRPSQVGGQEFDAVIVAGLEEGLVPPIVHDNDALGVALEQQNIRETYLSITRARYRVVFAISKRARPNALLQQCRSAQLVELVPQSDRA